MSSDVAIGKGPAAGRAAFSGGSHVRPFLVPLPGLLSAEGRGRWCFPLPRDTRRDSRELGSRTTEQFLEMAACCEDPAEIWRWLLGARYYGNLWDCDYGGVVVNIEPHGTPCLLTLPQPHLS